MTTEEINSHITRKAVWATVVKYFHKQKVYIKMKKLIPWQKKVEGKEKELKNYISQRRRRNIILVSKTTRAIHLLIDGNWIIVNGIDPFLIH